MVNNRRLRVASENSVTYIYITHTQLHTWHNEYRPNFVCTASITTRAISIDASNPCAGQWSCIDNKMGNEVADEPPQSQSHWYNIAQMVRTIEYCIVWESHHSLSISFEHWIWVKFPGYATCRHRMSKGLAVLVCTVLHVVWSHETQRTSPCEQGWARFSGQGSILSKNQPPKITRGACYDYIG